MARASAERMPRIALGVTHVRQALEELVRELEEPIAITVEGKRAAVLVPYDLYVEMVRSAEEEAEEEEGAT